MFEQVMMISDHDWDKLVKQSYGKPYSFQQQDGCKQRGIEMITIPCEYPDDYVNDTVPESVNNLDMGVSFTAWLERDSTKELNSEDWKSPYAIEMWWERNFYPHIDMVANDLYTKEIIPAGKYVINIDW